MGLERALFFVKYRNIVFYASLLVGNSATPYHLRANVQFRVFLACKVVSLIYIYIYITTIVILKSCAYVFV